MRNNFPFFTLGVIMTPILGFIGYFLFAFTNSGSNPSFYIFPWAFLGNFFHIDLPSAFLLLGFLQLPTYGLLLDVAKRKGRRLLAAAAIVISHLILIMTIP